MTKLELTKYIENVPDDYIIVVPGYDHSYSLAEVDKITVLKEGKHQYTDNVFDDPIGGKIVGAVVFS